MFKYYQRRLTVMKRIVAEADELSLDLYWRALLHHEQAPGCQHLETRPPGVNLMTFGGFAALPREGRYLTRIIGRDQNGLRYACQNQPAEALYSSP